MGVYSFSKIKCFEQCSLRYKYRYIEKIQPDFKETVEAFLGLRVHETLEHLYAKKMGGLTLPLQELISWYDCRWCKLWNDGILVVKKNFSIGYYKTEGIKLIESYYKRHFPFDSSQTLILESQKIVDLGNQLSYHIRIDRLAISGKGTFEIHDYKTSSSVPCQVDIDSSEQLTMYSFGVKRLYPEAKDFKLVWHFLRFDKELVSVRSVQDIERVRNCVIEKILRIEGCTDYISNPSPLCSWCEYKFICPNPYRRIN